MLFITVFIITALMVIGISMTKILISSNKGANIEVLGARAFLVAQSAIEVGVARLLPASDPLNPIAQSCDVVTQAIHLPSTEGFSNCKASLTCESKTVSDGQTESTDYRITSIGTCGEQFCSQLDNCMQVNRLIRYNTASHKAVTP